MELTASRGQFGHLFLYVYRKVIKQANMQVSKLVSKWVEVTKFKGLLGSGYVLAEQSLDRHNQEIKLNIN